MAILISDIIDFRTKKHRNFKSVHIVLICQKNNKFLNVNATDKIASKQTKQEKNGQNYKGTDNSTII